jgi:miniconductance mechanosensitive channel
MYLQSWNHFAQTGGGFPKLSEIVRQSFGAGTSQAMVLAMVVVAVLVAAVVAHLLTRLIVVGIATRVARRTRTQWDDFLVERKFFSRMAHLVPALVLFYSKAVLPPAWWVYVDRVALSYISIVGTLASVSILNVVVDIYGTLESAKSNPIKGFVQGAKLFVIIVGTIFLLSAIMGQSPWRLVAGIGAVTAVLLLVFKDTILGLVASIQILANDLVNLGDWIEMPKYGADGDVIDITLTTIKIRNFDNTITSIPTYSVISDSFKNWRGMQESGGRRIKRAIQIDMTSVKFLTGETLERFERFELLKDYITNRKAEVLEYNREHQIDTREVINGRRLTNLGTFRAYVKAYLHRHPKISEELTFLVRQLPPSAEGIPLEIYVFSSDKNWVRYEEIQADIFDHLLAVIPEFGLRVFQNPAGADFRSTGLWPANAAD